MTNINKPARVPGSSIRSYIRKLRPVQNSKGTIFAEWTTPTTYTVFSYGHHWPLHVYEQHTDRWFSNEGKYGVTTSKHYSQTHPHKDTTALSCSAIKLLAKRGYAALVEYRLAGEEV